MLKKLNYKEVNVMAEQKQEKPQMGEGVFHESARPMKVYIGDDGIMYLCDKEIDPDKSLKSQACWTCDQVLFNRGG